MQARLAGPPDTNLISKLYPRFKYEYDAMYCELTESYQESASVGSVELDSTGDGGSLRTRKGLIHDHFKIRFGPRACPNSMKNSAPKANEE